MDFAACLEEVRGLYLRQDEVNTELFNDEHDFERLEAEQAAVRPRQSDLKSKMDDLKSERDCLKLSVRDWERRRHFVYFTRLPIELREMIYAEYFQNLTIHDYRPGRRPPRHTDSFKAGSLSSLTMACKQLRLELTDWLSKHRTIVMFFMASFTPLNEDEDDDEPAQPMYIGFYGQSADLWRFTASAMLASVRYIRMTCRNQIDRDFQLAWDIDLVAQEVSKKEGRCPF
ncbi:hypothetical protein Slin14017_G124880 [Septoria linicola]|nr:hypothetical protein Slin14017_G124880 [Septoria linicola]